MFWMFFCTFVVFCFYSFIIVMYKPVNPNILSNFNRYGMFVPLVLMLAALVSGCISYCDAKKCIADDLNDAVMALANENRELWTRQDTISALRHIHLTTHQPLIYQASDVNFRNPLLKDEAFIAIALVDSKLASPKIHGNKIASDSIIIVPENSVDGQAIQVRGFTDCSMASVIALSDPTLPGILFSLSILSMMSMFVFRRRLQTLPDAQRIPSLDGIKLTPMQRQLTRMLLESPDMKVDKATLCTTLWGNKDNADESLYTLIRRTKAALADANIEIICNRGDSYQLRINR